MAHVLITGMTASQASPASLKRFRSFGGLVADVLLQSGHSGVIAPLAGNLDQYDSILVGLAPILSLGANNAYTALRLIDLLTSQNDPRLRFFVDAPTPAHITAMRVDSAIASAWSWVT